MADEEMEPRRLPPMRREIRQATGKSVVRSWLYEKTNQTIASGTPIPPAAQVLPFAVLGAVRVEQKFAQNNREQRVTFVSIAISFPGGLSDVDRLRVYLRAPYNVPDTQYAFVGGPDAVPGIVISDDPAAASKVLELTQNEFKTEVAWTAANGFIAFEHPSPVAPEQWRAVIVSASRTAANKISDSPGTIFGVNPEEPDVSGREFAPTGLNFHLVDGPARRGRELRDVDAPLRWKEQDGGNWLWGWSAAWSNDERDPRFPALEGYDLDVDYPSGERETLVSKSVNDLSHDTELWPLTAEDEGQTFTIWLVSFSRAGKNSIVEDLTPSVSFVLTPPAGSPGIEYAPLVTGFHIVSGPTYVLSDGNYTLQFVLAWTKPASPRYSGVVICCRIDSGGFDAPISGLETGTTLHVLLGDLPSVARTWNFYALSVNGTRQNTYQAGITPEASVLVPPPPTGGPGVKYAPVVTGFTTTFRDYALNAAGQRVLRFDFVWSKPSTPVRYASAILFMARDPVTPVASLAVAKSGTMTGTRFSLEISDYLNTAEQFMFLLYSVDVNGNQNDYAAGVTPTLTYTIGPPLSGTVPVSAFAASVVTDKDEAGNNISRFSGSFTFASSDIAANPDWAGIRIWRGTLADGSNAKPISPAYRSSPWQTDWEPLKPDPVVWLFGVSIDVNGKSGDIATAPRVGPLAIVPQGGTIFPTYINNAAIASGLDVPGQFNINPGGSESLSSALTKIQTQMYNLFDRKMYRWYADSGFPNGGYYKATGAGTDLVAGTVFGYAVAAYAIGSIQMSTLELRVGPPLSSSGSGLGPALITVEDASRNLIAAIGRYSGWDGIFGRNLRIGPTFANWHLDSDDTAFRLKNIDMYIAGDNGRSEFIITPQTFDASYSSLAAQMRDMPAFGRCWAAFISRGLVVWEKTLAGVEYQIGALARGPAGSSGSGWGELTLYSNDPTFSGVPTRTIFIDGKLGLVQASYAFQVGANLGQTSTPLLALAGGGQVRLWFLGGILVNVTSS